MLDLSRIAAGASLCIAACNSPAAAAARVYESAREIPVVYDIDVVVVGGTTAGGAAAVKAASAGASVFLAAPRPYRGEDLCATYRLWLEPGETPDGPLAKRVYADPRQANGIPYTYRADQPSAPRHKDSVPPARLCDGQWDDAISHSVQYDVDTTVTCDFNRPQSFRAIRFMLFQSPHNSEVESIDIAVSDDGTTWRPLGIVCNDSLGKGTFVESAFELTGSFAASTRYVKCAFKKGPQAQRMLLGEIHFVPQPGDVQPESNGLAMTVKRTLDDALLEADVPFLFGSYVTEVLKTRAGVSPERSSRIAPGVRQ